jgi:AcrR family transcriptional regulator
MTRSVKDKPAKPRRTGTKGVPRAERENQLLDLAERALAERGYHAASMDEIAAAAGITKPIIYSYFGSKEGLYVAAIHRAYEDCVQRVELAAAGGDDPGELLTRVIGAVFSWVEDNREQWPYVFGARALGGEFAEEAANALTGMGALIARILRQVITDPAATDELEPLGEACVAVTTALADHWIRHPEVSRELEEARVIRILAPAIAAHAGASPG